MKIIQWSDRSLKLSETFKLSRKFSQNVILRENGHCYFFSTSDKVGILQKLAFGKYVFVILPNVGENVSSYYIALTMFHARALNAADERAQPDQRRLRTRLCATIVYVPRCVRKAIYCRPL